MNAELISVAKDLLTIIVLLGGGIAGFVRMQRKLDIVVLKQTNMEQDMVQIGAEIKEDVKDLADVVVLQGRHDERLTALQQTVVNQGRLLNDTIRRMNTFLDLNHVNRIENDES